MATKQHEAPPSVIAASSEDPGPEEAAFRTLPEDLRDLADNARDYALAELAFQKSRAAYAGSQVRNITLLIVSAAVLVFFAVMAFVLGAVIALSPLLGGWGAAGVVMGALVVIAFLCLLAAKARWKRTMTLIADDRAPV